MRALACAVVLFAAILPPPVAAQGTAALEDELGRIAPMSGGQLGIAALHLESGRSVVFGGGEAFPMASSYKVPIAVQLLSRVDKGELSLMDMVDLGPEDLHPGSGTLSNLFDDPGVSLSVRNLLELMLLISDNSATDLCLALAGGPEAVNGRLAELGVRGVRVDRPTSVLIGDWVGVPVPRDGRISGDEFTERRRTVSDSQREAAAERFTTDPKDTATPEGMTALLRSIWAGEALEGESTELLMDVLRRVETGTGRIKGMLPPDVVVRHKTGTIGGTTNDVGFIELPGGGGTVAITAFVKNSDRPVEERERAIAQASRAVYDFFLFNPGH